MGCGRGDRGWPIKMKVRSIGVGPITPFSLKTSNAANGVGLAIFCAEVQELQGGLSRPRSFTLFFHGKFVC